MTKSDEQLYLEDEKAIENDFKKYMFHPMRDKVFAGLLINKELCELVIYAVTGTAFTVQDIRPQYYEYGELDQGRAIILDIKAISPGGTVCNLEVQVKYYSGGAHENRVVFHGSRLLSKQLKIGEGFDAVRPVIVVFFNFESASKAFIRHISLIDENGALYSNLLHIYEINTMENSLAGQGQEFIKIFSFFLLYACEQEKFYKKLAIEGISPENHTVKMLIRLYNALIGNDKVKEELKIMEMTSEDRTFLATRNFADVLEKGREEGLERGLEKGIKIGIGTTLSIIRDLQANKSVKEIAELYKISIQQVEEIQSTLNPHTA